MAVPLAFKGVMWGADKVPDHWFEKLPGNYFRGDKKASLPDDKETKSSQKKRSSDMKKHRSSSRRYSDDEYDDEKPGRGSRDDGYRSDGHRSSRHRRNGKADGHTRFDGGGDDFDEINNRPRRQRSRAGRRDSDDRYGYGDGHRPPFRDTQPRKPRAQMEPPPHNAAFRNQGPLERPPMGFNAVPAAMGGAAAMSAAGSAYGSPAPGPHPVPQSTSSLRGGIATDYVPYAHIYGGPTHPQHQHSDFAPPPSMSEGSVQPTFMNQVSSPTGPRPEVTRPPAGYYQNPLAQEAPHGNQPGYMVDPSLDDRRDDYDAENERPESRSPPRRRRSRRDRSRERYESPDSRDGRHSSRREHSRHEHRAKSHGTGKSSIQENIDTSQRGLGYTAVGALAGGLLGNEVGNGVVPSAVGALVGAIGANSFQARERYVDGDPRKPSNARVSQQPTSRRKRASMQQGKDGYYSD